LKNLPPDKSDNVLAANLLALELNLVMNTPANNFVLAAVLLARQSSMMAARIKAGLLEHS